MIIRKVKLKTALTAGCSFLRLLRLFLNQSFYIDSVSKKFGEGAV